jgi:hypothetical protein
LAIAGGLFTSIAVFGGLNEPIRRLLQEAGQQYFGGRFEIQQLEGNPLFRFRLSGVSWISPGGDLIKLGEARIQYRPGWMLLGRLTVDSLHVVSPQISLVGGAGSDLAVPAIPEMDLQAATIQHGVLSLDGEEIARDVSVAFGFDHQTRGSRLILRQMHSVIFDPPIEVTNLDGIILRQDQQIVLEAVRLRTVMSMCQIDGTIEWGDPPRVDLTARSDSRAAESPLTYLGIDAPATDGWVTGTFFGPLDSLEVDFQWVAGGAAGEGRASGDVWHSPRRLRVDMSGKDVNLGVLVGLGLSGNVSTRVDLEESFGEVTGGASILMSPVSFLNGRFDSAEAQLTYVDRQVEGSVRVVGGSGHVDLNLSFDTLTETGQLAGEVVSLNLAAFKGPPSAASGQIEVHVDPAATRVMGELRALKVAGFDCGSGGGSAVFSQAGGYLESLVWTGVDDAFRLTASGPLTPAAGDSVDGLNLRVAGQLHPTIWHTGSGVPQSVEVVGSVYEKRGLLGARSRWANLAFRSSSPFLGVDSVRATVELEGHQVRIDALRGTGRQAIYEASGSLVLDRSWDVVVRGKIGSLDDFPLPNWVVLPGEATLQATAFGPWHSPDLEVTASTDTLRFFGAPLVRPRLRIHRTEHAGLSFRVHSLRWAGRELQGLYADLVDEGGTLTFLVGNATASQDRIQVWGGALRSKDQTRIHIDSMLVRSGDVMVANQGPSSMTWSAREGLRVQRLAFGGRGGSLLAKSSTGPSKTLDVTVDRVDLRPWAFVFGIDETLGGHVSANASFDRERENPAVVATLDVRDFRWEDYVVDSIKADLRYQSQVAHVELYAWSGDGTARVSGSVPFESGQLDGRGELDVGIVGHALDLRLAEGWVSWLSHVSGKADIDLRLTGSPAQTVGNGSVHLSDGAGTIGALAQTLSDVSAHIILAPGRVEIDEAVGTGGEGRVEAVGMVEITPFNFIATDSLVWLKRLDLEIRARGLKAVNLAEFQATVDADVRLTGPIDTPAVAGRVSFEEAEIRLLSMLEAPEDPESVWTTVPFFRNLESSLQLVAQNQVWVRDENLNVELNGDVDLLRDEDGVRLFGSLSTLRGSYRFQNRDFRIELGQIDFIGAGTIDPTVSIVGATRLPIIQDPALSGEREDLTVRVIVGGTITQPEITLESDPPVGDEATILSYILLGRPPDDFLSGQQSLFGERSAGLVVGLAANQLKERIGQELNLDVLQLEMATGTRVSRIQVGKYISDRIFVSYDDPIGTDAREFTVEYELLKDLMLESRVGFNDEGDQKSKLFITWRKDW